MKDKTTFFKKKRLETSGYLGSTLSNDLLQTISKSADKLNGFFVVDSQAKKWWASKKFGYPPDKLAKATDRVIPHAETQCEERTT